MIIYRPHRGSLQDAMAEARVFANEGEMKHWIAEDSAKAFGKPLFSVDDIVIDLDAIVDSRNGWNDTRYVCIKRYGGEVYPVPQCIGMCATDFPAAEVN